MKILHTADNHLGAPLIGLSPQAAKERKEELLDTFLRTLRFADEQGVDAVFLCGDLFDDAHPSSTLLRQVVEGIAACRAQVFYVTGNHDDGVVFPYAPDNFHRFDKGLKSYRLGEITVTGADYDFVHGGLKLPKMDENTYNFLLLHGDIRQSFSTAKGQIDLSQVAQKNIDYLALGHIHDAPAPIRLDGRGVARYSGAPEGHGFDECGKKGFWLIETGQGLRQTFVPFALRTYHEIDLAVTGIKDGHELESAVAKAVEGLPQTDGVKVRLKGSVSAEAKARIEGLQRRLQEAFFAAKVVDDSLPDIDFSAYEKDKTIKGQLVRLAAQLPEGERAQILSIAFRALSGEDLDV